MRGLVLSNENYYLYKITNLVNGKMYIGVTNNPNKRERQHLHEKPKKNKTSLIKNAALKYGAENFRFEVICIGDQEYIYDLERKVIDIYDTINSGYNLVPGGLGGLGKKVTKRSDDYECYVSGFWFPNKRTACSAMNITNANVFYKQKKDGTLGDVCRTVKGSVSGNPIYYKGLWFESASQASEILGRSVPYILSSIKKGRVEENTKKITKHPERFPVINDEIYESIEHASELLGVSKYTLKSRFYIGKEGYSYQYIIKE